MDVFRGDALDLISSFNKKLDLIVTDPPYAMGGSGLEHALTASVAIVLRESALKLNNGCWMIVFSASSWRSTHYMIKSLQGVLEPVRLATWCKPVSKTKVKNPGWAWASVNVIAFRKGPKNNLSLPDPSSLLDYIVAPPLIKGRRAELPEDVAKWAIEPFVIKNGNFLDPFSGSGVLAKTAENLGMESFGFEIQNN